MKYPCQGPSSLLSFNNEGGTLDTGSKPAKKATDLLLVVCEWKQGLVNKARLTLSGSLDHKLSDLLLHPPFTTFRALYLTLFVFTYGHYRCEYLFTVKAPILISRHSHPSLRSHQGQSNVRPNLKLFYEDYSELWIVMSTNIGMTQLWLRHG